MLVLSRHITLRRKATTVAFFCILALASCEYEPVDNSPNALLRVPDHFPAMEFPPDNSFSEVRWELGRKLFFDPILSRDSTISCNSCHKAEFAMADNFPVSPGIEGRIGERNSPSLFNTGYLPYLLREGGIPTLEMQVLVPIQEHAEMDFNIVDAAERMENLQAYVDMSRMAYARTPDPFVITRALATYQRTMISGNSVYDDVLRGRASLSASEERGMQLFFSPQTQCSSCHGGLFFSDHSFANNGLYAVYNDPGRMRLTNDSADFAQFRVPSLRNVEYTAPYMHDGSLATLRDVIEHYNSGGANNPQKDARIQPLQLTQGEMDDLLAFLKTLSDPNVLTDPRFQAP